MARLARVRSATNCANLIREIQDAGKSLLNPGKLSALWGVLDATQDVPGDLAELGVYRGGVARLMASHSPRRTVRLFDTFAGIPATAQAGDYHKAGEFAEPIDEVRAYLADCPNVTYHAGTFPETATGETFAVVHIDADLYQSTIDGLRYFWPRLSVGGAIVLDDWQWSYCLGVEKAVEEFFADCSGFTFDEAAPHQLIVWKDA